jgi:acetyltransferase-like isoleucine patch superfamily enzyme
MKAFLWKTGQRISPFQDPVQDLLVLNRPLREHQDATLRKHGLQVGETEDPCSIPDEEFLLVRDDLYFTDAALGRFLEKVRTDRKPGACALERGPFTDFTGFAQPLRDAVLPDAETPVKVYGLFYCRKPLPSAAALDELPPVRIEAEQMAFPIRPGEMLPSTVEITFTPAYTDAVMIHLCHWTHLWLANLMALGGTLFRTFTRSKFRMVMRALSAFSFNKHKIASRFVVQGKGCDIHPSAVVQGCILGDGVSIGAHCLVQGCILGDGVKVNEFTILLGSVFGEGSSTSPRGWTKFCVVYPKSSTTGHALHGSVVGRNVFMASPAYLYDLKIKGTIKILHQGRRVDTGLNFLGSCVGHEAIIGPDIWLASGMEIPNRAVVVKNPGEIITSIPDDLPEGEYLTVRNGQLVPVRDLIVPPT